MIRKGTQFVFLLFVLLPILVLLMLSFGKYWTYPAIFPSEFTWEHWLGLTQTSSGLLQTVFQSIALSSVVSLLVTVSGFFVSKEIAYSTYRTVFIVFAYIPYVLSPILMAVILQYFFSVTQVSGTFFGVIIAQFFIAFPFGVLVFLNFWNTEIKAMESVSYTLGASWWQTQKRIVFTMAKPAVVLCYFQVFLISWFEYGLTNLIGIGKVNTLTIQVFNFINEANIFYAALACILLILPPIVLLLLNKRLLFLHQTLKS